MRDCCLEEQRADLDDKLALQEAVTAAGAVKADEAKYEIIGMSMQCCEGSSVPNVSRQSY